MKINRSFINALIWSLFIIIMNSGVSFSQNIVGYSHGELWSVDFATGSKSSITPGVDLGGYINSTYDATNQTYYLLEGLNNHLISIDVATGQVTDSGFNPGYPGIVGLQYDPTLNMILGYSHGELWSVDFATGSKSSITPGVDLGGYINSTYDATNQTYYLLEGLNNHLISIDVATGQVTDSGFNPGYPGIVGLQYDPTLNMILGYSHGELWSVDFATGSKSSITPGVDLGGYINSTYDATNQTYYLLEGLNNHLISIDVATGQVTDSGFNPGYPGIVGLHYANPIPEPATLFLFALGGLLIRKMQ